MAFSNLFPGGLLNAIYRNEETPKLAGLPEKAELDVELREIFKMYATIEAADAPAFLPKNPDEPCMGPRAFSVFVRDAKLLDNRTTLADARAVIYETINNRKSAGEAARGDGLRFEEWLEALWMFSDRFAGLAPVDAAASLLASHITGVRKWSTPPADAADGVCDPELQAVFEEYWRPLQQLFVFYGRRSLPAGARLSFQEAVAHNIGLSLPEFGELLADFGLSPAVIDALSLLRIFTRAWTANTLPPEDPAVGELLTARPASRAATAAAAPTPSGPDGAEGEEESSSEGDEKADAPTPPPEEESAAAEPPPPEERPPPPSARLHYAAFLEALALIALEHFGERGPPPAPPAPDVPDAANGLPPAIEPPRPPLPEPVPKGAAGARQRLARVRALMRVLDLAYGPRFGLSMQDEVRKAPPVKPRPAPVVGERRPGALTEEEEASLRRIWLIYSAVGERHVDTGNTVRAVPPRKGGMTAFQWALFVRNSAPGGEEPSDGALAELFDRAVRFGETVEPLMYFTGFKRGLRLLSKLRMRRSETPDEAYRAFAARLIRRAHGDLFVVRPRIRGPAPAREVDPLAAALAALPRRPARSLDVFCGPVLVARADDAPGHVRPAPGPGPAAAGGAPRKHPFLDVWLHEPFVASRLAAHVDLAESFDHLLRRLRRDGFDLAPSADPASRRPVGRCWHVRGPGSQGPGTHVATVLDYPGQFGTLGWQPTAGAGEHAEITMCVYEEGEAPGGDAGPGRLLLELYGAFARAKSLAQLRHRLAGPRSPFSLAPVLYTPH